MHHRRRARPNGEAHETGVARSRKSHGVGEWARALPRLLWADKTGTECHVNFNAVPGLDRQQLRDLTAMCRPPAIGICTSTRLRAAARWT